MEGTDQKLLLRLDAEAVVKVEHNQHSIGLFPVTLCHRTMKDGKASRIIWSNHHQCHPDSVQCVQPHLS